jgi:poly-gamma-glutamate synthesis protein (capsule biosynthesis protein)
MLESGDVAAAFGDTLPLFGRSDLAVVNLEAPLCGGGKRIPKLGPSFRASPAVASALKAAGVDVCCLANNHAMDHGAPGLRQTLRSLKAAGLAAVGAGSDPRVAARPLRRRVNGVRVALLSAGVQEGVALPGGPCAARLDPIALRRDVAAEAARGAVVIPILHAGREEAPFPSPGMRLLCRELVNAGAAAVVAHHPHVPQGIESHRGRPIAYSLGNFLFDWPVREPHTDSSFLLELRVTGGGVAGLAVHPFRKSASGGVCLMRGRSRAAFLGLLRALSAPLREDGLAVRMWEEQCRPRPGWWYWPRLARLAGLRAGSRARRVKAQLTLLNMMETFEHGEVLQAALRGGIAGRGRGDRVARRTLDRLHRLMRRLGSGLAALVLAAGVVRADQPPAAAGEGEAGGLRWLPSHSGAVYLRYFLNQTTPLEKYRYGTEGVADLRYEIVRWDTGRRVALDVNLLTGMGQSVARNMPLSPVDLEYRLAPCFETRRRFLWRAGWDHACNHLVYKDRDLPWYHSFGSHVAPDVFYNRPFAGVGSAAVRREDVWRACFRDGAPPRPVWYVEIGAYLRNMGSVLPPSSLYGGQDWDWDASADLRLPVWAARSVAVFAGAKARLLADVRGDLWWRTRVETEAMFRGGEYGISVFAGGVPLDEHPRDSQEGLLDIGARFLF